MDGFPSWSASGKEIVFASRRDDGAVYSVVADGGGNPERLVSTSSLSFRYPEWSPDGKHLIYGTENPGAAHDVWYVETQRDTAASEPVAFLQTSFDERSATFSPDGGFVAYVSDESGQFEIYVTPFPDGGSKWRVSENSGTQPRWSKDGKELFYVKDDTLMAVSVSTTPSFSVGPTTELFAAPLCAPPGPEHNTTFRPTGNASLCRGTLESEQAQAPSIHIVQNWYEEFRDREQD